MPIPYRWRDALVRFQDRLRPSFLRAAAPEPDWARQLRGENLRDDMDVATIRRSLNENSIVVSAALGVVILIALIYMWRSFFGNRYNGANVPMVFINEETNAAVTMTPKPGEPLIPPLTDSAGKDTLVLAIYYTCDDCKTKQIAYLQKYTPEAKLLATKLQTSKDPVGMNEDAFMKIQQGLLVKSAEAGSKWVYMNSAEGEKVTTAAHCDKGQPPHFNVCN